MGTTTNPTIVVFLDWRSHIGADILIQNLGIMGMLTFPYPYMVPSFDSLARDLPLLINYPRAASSSIQTGPYCIFCNALSTLILECTNFLLLFKPLLQCLIYPPLFLLWVLLPPTTMFCMIISLQW